ncbi:MAG: energy transducer TonB, partial [Thermoanaerobaculia bacterium]
IVMMRGRSSTPAPVVATKPASPSAPVTTTPPPPTASTTAAANPAATGTIVPAASDTTATSTQAPVLDQAQVDAEIQKRMAAERARLEEQKRAQQTPAPAPPSRPAPVLTATQAAVQPAPAPVTLTVPPPPPPAPATASASETAAPQPANEAPQRAKEGDLVLDGTEGLTPARMTRQAQATYPPIARIQRLQGAVIVNALISENGQVLETRVISSPNKSPLLNDAAQQTVRRSAFTPGTKDGVRVKSWTTVRIEFKL